MNKIYLVFLLKGPIIICSKKGDNMLVSNTLQTNYFIRSAGEVLSYLNSSVSKYSGLIFAGSAALLGGGIAYTVTQGKFNEAENADPNFAQIRARVASAYTYVFGSLGMTAATAALAHVAGFSRVILENNALALPLLCIASFAGVAVTLLSDKSNVNLRHAALAITNITIGIMLSPLGFIPGSLVAQAALITAGIGGLMTFVAYIAPDESFLKYQGPLLAGLTTISLASLAALFFPNTAFAYGADRLSLYGGLAIFTGLLAVDTQAIISRAKKENDAQFDPIDNARDLYWDTLSVFLRILRMILENSQKDKASSNT